MQDVFVRLWSNPHTYNAARGDLRRWLLTVTHHASVDGLRGKRGTARMRDSGSEPLGVLPHGGDDPSESVWKMLRAEHVRAALAALPMIIFFLTFQRYFLEGVRMGAVKG